MTKKSLYIIADVADLYSKKRISRAAAALSYYFTMTFFPMVICLYYLMGSNAARISELVDMSMHLIPAEIESVLAEFLVHVARSKSPALLLAGLTVLVTSSSAAIRTLLCTIGEMQGGLRYHGLMHFAISILFSFVFLVTMYFSMLIILTGRAAMDFINSLLTTIDISSSWVYLRYLLLAGILFMIIWALYRLSKRRCDKYRCYPGALLCTLALVVMSVIFSATIEYSAKYSLVYGSIASVILLMLWLYFSCQIIYIGAAFNIALRNQKISEEKDMLTGGRIKLREIHEKYLEYKSMIERSSKKISLKLKPEPKKKIYRKKEDK